MRETSRSHHRPPALDPFAGLILALVFALGIVGGTIAFMLHPNEVAPPSVVVQGGVKSDHSG